ncbi:MAG: aminotransferase [Lachnospiraceae bacterium]|nr:aminotransferase [Lachnospiraceae bacterium]MDY5742344.1 aminotransferase [Lachnospiraceae bacterium]
MTYQSMTREQLEQEQARLTAAFAKVKAQKLTLDMSRGKPGKEQLELVMDMLDTIDSHSNLIGENGMDYRNYGVPEGVIESRRLFADLMEVPVDNVLVMGNSSLNIMFDVIAHAMTHGVMGGTPWTKQEQVRFLCPVPGYDRHFGILQHFGIEMINVTMTENGPDMDQVEALVNTDASIKGIWCVPKYSNPQGYSYSDETVRRLAALKPATADFRLYWDNAYAVHHLYADDQDQLLEILAACRENGNEDLVYEFCSTSKISFPGAGVAALISSEANLADLKKAFFYQTIGHDKLNQLRHARYFRDPAGVAAKMKEHAEVLRPKFEAVWKVLEREIAPLGIGSWTTPKGGYFISFETLEGCAAAVVAKCKEGGMVLTGAGAPFPYGKDPKDTNIRIAPTFPAVAEMEQAAELFALCVKLVSVDKLLREMA